MRRNFLYFLASEDGAVTVDWVVLTAMIVGLALVVGFTVSSAATGPKDGIAAYIDDQGIGTY